MIATSVPLLFNPTAGRGRAGRRAEAIVDMLGENGVRTTPVPSRAEGDIEQMAFDMIGEGHRHLIVAGGDGSIHEAVNGIMRAGGEADLSIIPIGTGNDFAKAASIPVHWEHAAALLADRIESGGSARSVDVGRCNERYFANGAGIGFDAKVSAIARDLRLPMGDLVYLLALFRAMRSRVTTPRLTMTFGDERIEGEMTLANFSNGPWVGGMFHIAPDARNDDGLLDLVYADPVSRGRIVTLLPKLLRGTHLDAPEVHAHTLRKCRVIADAPVVSHLDGEVQPPQSEFEIELLPGALRLL